MQINRCISLVASKFSVAEFLVLLKKQKQKQKSVAKQDTNTSQVNGRTKYLFLILFGESTKEEQTNKQTNSEAFRTSLTLVSKRATDLGKDNFAIHTCAVSPFQPACGFSPNSSKIKYPKSLSSMRSSSRAAKQVWETKGIDFPKAVATSLTMK